MAQSFDQIHGKVNQKPLDDLRLLSPAYWAELRIFLAVAKAKSFNRASAVLDNMSQPTISRSVKRLQDIIGSQLIESSKSGIILTESGKELAESLLALDEKLFSIANDLRGQSREAAGLVRLTSTEAMATLFIVPSLSEFTDQYPNIQVHIRNPVNLIGYRENQSDIVLSYAPSTSEEIESRHIGFLHLVPVANKSYFDRYGVPIRGTLQHHRFIDADYYSSKTETWGAWRSAVRQGTIAHCSDNSFAYGFMVKSGLGIGLLSNFTLVDPALIPLELGIHVQLPLYLLASSDRLRTRSVRAVYDWLTQVFSKRYHWFGKELVLAPAGPEATLDTIADLYDGTEYRLGSAQR